jgi:peptidoglycan/LPS O-acetylase OafA/YrhL
VNIWEGLIVVISLPLLDFLLKIRVPPINLLFFIILGDISLILVFFLLYSRGRVVNFVGILLGVLARYLIISQSAAKIITDNHLYFESNTLLFATLLGGILAFIAIPQLEKEQKKRNELSR